MLDKIIKSNYFKFFFFGLCFAILFSKSDRLFGWTNVEAKSSEPVISDGSGYYAYLPQWLTYHTSGFEFAGTITKRYPKTRFSEYAGYTTTRQKNHNKFYSGTAIGLVPFYVIAQIHSSSISVPADGYSWPFLLWTNIGMICIALIGGLGFLRLSRSYNIKPWISYFGLVAILFGTNLCYYTTVEIPFSHVICFAVNTWVLVFAKEWATKNKRKHFYWFSALIGWAIIIRPTNILVLIAIPFLFNSTRSFVERLKELILEKRFQLLIGVVLASVFVAFQLWNVWVQTGELHLNAYPNETFVNWQNPEIWNVLFSWKKGLFVYAPLLILLVPALFVCFKKERRMFWGIVLVFCSVTYMTASWWMWWFGGGLGARNHIDFMGLFGLALLVLIQYSHWIFKTIFCGLAILSIWIYGIYDYQMRHAILSYDKMTESSFKTVFLQTDARFAWYPDRVFDKKPANFKNIESAHFFLDINYKQIVNRVVESDKNEFQDNPKLKVAFPKSKKWVNSDRFGLEINIETRIYDHFDSPSVQVFLFKKDSLLEEESIQYGGKIPTQKDWNNVQLFMNMKTKCSEIDSVGILIFDGLGNMGIRNAKAQFYSYKLQPNN